MIDLAGRVNMDRCLLRAAARCVVVLSIALTVSLVGSNAEAAAQVFAKPGAKLFATSSGGVSIGVIMPGTELNVTNSSRKGDRKNVSITGWAVKGESKVLYKAPDVRIIQVEHEASASRDMKVLGHKQDAYGTDWEHVTIVGWVPAESVTDNVGTVWAAAKKIYDGRCSSCHALHAPDEYTANQWPGVLRTMARNAGLDEAQKVLVTQYLQTHARTP